MKPITDVIEILENCNKGILSDEFRLALSDAVVYLKQACPKPSLDEPVRNIRQFRKNNEHWRFYMHVPSHTWIEDMKIGDLVKLAMDGGLDNDKFESVVSKAQKRLHCGYVYSIKEMLILNGYMTREEAFGRGN